MRAEGGALDYCPECGGTMAPTLDGPPFCPSCGYQDAFSAPLVSQDESEELGHTLLYDADMLAPGLDANMAPGLGGAMPTPTALSQVQDTPRKGEPVVDGAPPSDHLSLPRCGRCERPLELDEVSSGVCIVCQSMRAGDEDGEGFSFGRTAEFFSGLLAVATTIWIVGFALFRAQSDAPDPVHLAAGLVLAAFAVLTGIGFAAGGGWAAGAGLALGLPAVVLAAIQLLAGELERDPVLGWTWLSAGLAGALVSLVALAAFRHTPAAQEWDEDAPNAPARRRRHRRPPADSGGFEAFAAAGVAVGAAGLAGWLAYSFFSGAGRAGATFSAASEEATLAAVVALAVSGLCSAILGVWFLKRPSAVPPLCSVLAAPLAGALPAWMLAAALVMEWNAARFLAMASGVGEVIAVDWLAALPRAATPEIFAFSVSALLIAGIFSLVGIFSREPRAAALSGYGLAWSLIWAAGIMANST